MFNVDSEWQYKCNSGQCTDEVNYCNGKQDCDDGSDEANCKDFPYVRLEHNNSNILNLIGSLLGARRFFSSAITGLASVCLRCATKSRTAWIIQTKHPAGATRY